MPTPSSLHLPSPMETLPPSPHANRPVVPQINEAPDGRTDIYVIVDI